MVDLRTRFGKLVKAHRTRLRLTQDALAERAGISVDMVSKIEGGSSGARFGVIAQLSEALGVDPAELFTTEVTSTSPQRTAYIDVSSRLAGLSDGELQWLSNLIDAALRPKS